MVCRSMFISEPRIELRVIENGGNTLIIEIDYGEVVQEDGHGAVDEALDFAQCLIRNIRWDNVAQFLKEKNIGGIRSISSYGAKIIQTDKSDPSEFGCCLPKLKTLELRICFSVEEDRYKAAAVTLRNYMDGYVVKEAIANEGKYKHSHITYRI